MSKHRLPVLEEPASSLKSDGRRNFVHPADVSGRFTRRRHLTFAALIAVYVALPFVKIGGFPAVFLDVAHRRFHLFGATFNASDFWLAFFLITGIGFSIVFVTTLFGRVFCGYACPQTVFLEGVFRRIERAIEGPRAERIRRNQGPLTLDKALRKTAKHVLFLGLAFGLAHVFLSYFVSLPSLATMMRASPSEHPEAFAWMMAVTGLAYLDFAWFREQLCLIICPYGRLQSALLDKSTWIIGYDTGRGEPRGKKGTEGAGDCIDCDRCRVVCPTGIDIRNGLQIDCVGCAACIDACDEVMARVGRPGGLVRYDSELGFAGKTWTMKRPRVFLYGVLGLVGLIVAFVSVRSRVGFEASMLRLAGTVFVVDGAYVRNPVQLQLVNKSEEPLRIRIADESDHAVVFDPALSDVLLAPEESRLVTGAFRVERHAMRPGLRGRLVFRDARNTAEVVRHELPVLGPRGNHD